MWVGQFLCNGALLWKNPVFGNLLISVQLGRQEDKKFVQGSMLCKIGYNPRWLLAITKNF